MRFKYETYQQRNDRLTKWHKHFTWLPTEIQDRIVWLETVWRKGNPYCYNLATYYSYEYKFKEETPE